MAGRGPAFELDRNTGAELMPDLKISQLPDGGAPQDTDQLSAARGTSSTIKLVWSTIRTALEGLFAPLSHVSDTDNPHVVTAAQAGAIPDTLAGDGELLSYDGAQYTKVATGTDGQVLSFDTAGGPGGKVLWTTQQEGRDVMAEGVPLANQTLGAVNFTGNGVNVAQNVGQDRYDVQIDNANAANVGGGGEVIRDITGSDPSTVNLRTFISGDATVSITQLADTLDLRATGGAGSGEENTQSNVGGGVELGLPKNGVDLPLRTLDTGQFELNTDQVRVQAGVFAPDAQAQTHYSNTSIHYPVSSLPGAGIVQNGSVLDVGQGDGITVSATTVAVDGTVARAGATLTLDELVLGDTAAAGVKTLGTFGTVDLPLISSGTGAPSFAQIVTGGIEDAAVTNAKRANMPANTISLRHTTGGVPQDAAKGDLPDKPAPGAGDKLIAFGATLGELVEIDVDNLPGGGGIGAGTPFVVGDLMAVESDAGDGAAESVGFPAAVVARTDIANTFTESQTVNKATGLADIDLMSGTSAVRFRLFPGDGTPDERAFRFASGTGEFIMSPILDNGNATLQLGLRVQHSGGATLGDAAGGLPPPGMMNAEGLQVDGQAVAVAAADSDEPVIKLAVVATLPGITDAGTLYFVTT
jgi:hypothetical protein